MWDISWREERKEWKNMNTNIIKRFILGYLVTFVSLYVLLVVFFILLAIMLWSFKPISVFFENELMLIYIMILSIIGGLLSK